MADTIEKLLNSLIQHGKGSNRVYLMKLADGDAEKIVPKLDELAECNGYTKIFSKVPARCTEAFLHAGHIKEGGIPRFYRSKEDAVFLGKFFDEGRKVSPQAEEIRKVLETAKQKAAEKSTVGKTVDNEVEIVKCDPDDADEMAMVYSSVFPSYPFPIDDPDYIRRTMETHVVYYAARYADNIVALSSAETDREASNVEMTDFATLPHWRGNGLSLKLLSKMEEDMSAQGIATAYTIARAISAGMNITFARAGYAFGGTLVNNTNISGSIESMNIWHKQL